ncbi:penicillin acylase family protein [Stenotrophomonas mori]|uniref:Penicillin acylase family protein n=1 Tax=Stenotrophomonas mori TaxID=2871096 RepID=A0ABT0SGY3_9GAMM|nr:penicillin acylase family protein [Stenotrophomonas mori]MCL7714584.1 penicillin acylase family protein [Stenotrophomonas mori]
MTSDSRRLARGTFLAGLLALAAAPAFAAAPHAAETAHWDAVAAQVEIVRDDRGVPHIQARSEEAAAFAFGYAQAEDHMVEIARRMVRARGEAARIFGEAEADNDFAMRRFDNLAEAGKDLERVSPTFRTVVSAFAAGLNRYVDGHRETLPEWVPRFTPADTMALIRSNAIPPLIAPEIIARLDRKYGPGEATAMHAAPAPNQEGPGSNAFALSGARTEGGHPILLANPHLNWSSLYWEAHIRVPGVLDFYGNTLAGYPVLWAGFNADLGWANTVHAADLDDLYALELDPSQPDHYRYQGDVRALVPRQVEIQVKQADGRLATRTRTYWESELGPIVHRVGGRAFAVRTTRLDAPLQFEGFYRLAQTRSLQAFQQVFRDHPTFGCNYIYADRPGNIYYLWNAPIPQRPDDGTDYSLDVPADASRIWTRVHGLDDMPALLNPPGGIVQNANNPPWWASPDDWIDPARYPAYFQRGPIALRPQLALDLLAGDKRYSPQDVLDLKFSPRMLLAERVLPDLLAALEAEPGLPEPLRAARAVLAAWDRQVAADSRGAVLFQAFWDRHSAALAQPFAQPWSNDAPLRTPRGLAEPAQALRHLQDAVADVRAQYGSEAVAWGEVNRIRLRGHDLPGAGADGSYGTFQVMRYVPAADGKRQMGAQAAGETLAGFGDNWIMMVEFSTPLKAWSVLGSGQSGDWNSPHSNDQVQAFQGHRLLPVRFTDEALQAHQERRYCAGVAACGAAAAD